MDDRVDDLAETDSAEQMKRFRRWYRDDAEHQADWRKEAEEDYAFVAGDQWDQKDIDTLKEQMRPVVTFNRVDPLIRSVCGEQINNAQEIRYIPVEQGDVKANEALTSGASWFRDQCDAEDEESEAFWDAAICGMGWTESRLDFAEDPEEPNPVIERIDPFEVLWDKNARKRNLSDARRMWRVKRDIPLEEAREMYPDAADSDLDASSWAEVDETGRVSDEEKSKEYDPTQTDEYESLNPDNTVTIVQCQWWEYRTFYKVLDPFTGETKTVDEAEKKKVETAVAAVAEQGRAMGDPTLAALKVQSVKLRKRVYKQAFLGRTVLKEKDSPCPDHFTFNAITGFRDRNKGTFYGLVRSMKDPQRWANKWLSQTMHIMNTNAKGGVMMEEGAVENQRDFEESYSKVEAVTLVPQGSLSNPNGPKIIPKPVGQFPAGFYQMMEFAISSIRDVAGVSLEMIGMREGAQAASLEYQRRQAGMNILAQLFRSLRRYHRNQGRVLLYYIQEYIAGTGRLVRIVGDEKAEYVPLAKSASSKYDIIVDEGPSSPNQKERVWSLIGEQFFGLPQDIQLALLDYSPFPESVVEKIKSAAQEASESPQAKMQEQMVQLEAMLGQARVLLTNAQAEKAKADAQESLADAALKGSQVGQPVGRDGVVDKGVDHAFEITKAREKNATDLEIAREKSRAAEDKALIDAQARIASQALGGLAKTEHQGL